MQELVAQENETKNWRWNRWDHYQHVTSDKYKKHYNYCAGGGWTTISKKLGREKRLSERSDNNILKGSTVSSTITECTFICSSSLLVIKMLSRIEGMAFCSWGAKSGQKLFK